MENIVLSCLESRIENNRNLYGRFLLGPFINGHALTLATALRRALLSEIKGVAITALEIQGTTHEFSTIEGVRESVLDIALNFQHIVLHSEVDLTMPEVGYLQVQGPAVIRAIDLKLPLGIQCVDPTQYIATLSTNSFLVLKFLIAKGNKSSNKSSSYKKDNSLITARHVKKAKMFYKNTRNLSSPSTENLRMKGGKDFKSEICFRNIIPLDSMFTPVHRVNFLLEVDDLSNKPRERLIFEVWTNGSIHPRQALHEAALSLIDLFSIFREINHLDSHSSLLLNRGKMADKQNTYNTEVNSPLSSPLGRRKDRRAMSTAKQWNSSAPFILEQSSSVEHLKQVQVSRREKKYKKPLSQSPDSSPVSSLAVRPVDNTVKKLISQKKQKFGEKESASISTFYSKRSLQILPSKDKLSYKAKLMRKLASLYKTNFDKNTFISLDISNLSLSLKTYTLLKQNGIHTMDQLLKYSTKKLFQLVNSDKKMFYDVKQCILSLGLQMKK